MTVAPVERRLPCGGPPMRPAPGRLGPVSDSHHRLVGAVRVGRADASLAALALGPTGAGLVGARALSGVRRVGAGLGLTLFVHRTFLLFVLRTSNV